MLSDATLRQLDSVTMIRTASLFSAYIVALLLMAAAYAFAPPAPAEAAAVTSPRLVLVE